MKRWATFRPGTRWVLFKYRWTLEQMAEAARAAVGLGVTKIRLTGGEPLVKRGIVRLVGMIAAIQGLEHLAMTTNGTLLAPWPVS